MSLNDIRKNFVFKKEVAQHLEEIAKKENKSMTKIIEELIEKKYSEVSKENKLKALNELAGSGTGLFGDLSIQKIKANMDV